MAECGVWALIRESDNIVDNTVMWDGNVETWPPPEGIYWRCIEGVFCSSGFTYDKENDVYIDPREVPETPVIPSVPEEPEEPEEPE